MKFLIFLVLFFSSVFAENILTMEELIAEQNDKFYQSIDNFDDKDGQYTVKKLVNGVFGLKPHYENYLLPISYREGEYASYTPSDKYRNIEAEMQVSLAFDVYTDLFNFGERYTLAYTQKSMWQIYTDSSPFRETNYNPEFLVSFPVFHKSDILSVKMLILSLSHQSNGQGDITDADFNTTVRSNNQFNPLWFENRSRSWNYVTAQVVMQHKSFFIGLKGWYRLPEDAQTDDNPDLIDYIGHGELTLMHLYGKALARAKIRHNFETGKGSAELSLSYPVVGQENVYFYGKIFTGYNETLIDYDNYITKFALGFSFSR